jgi:hypothetical protein
VIAPLGVLNRQFEENALTSAADAVKIILDGVQAGRWRILVRQDAYAMDQTVRAAPESAYDADRKAAGRDGRISPRCAGRPRWT